MAVLQALRRSGAALGRNPVVLAVAALLALAQVPQFAAQWLGPLVSAVVSLAFSVLLIVVLPFVQGGLVAMADEALDGTTSLSTLVDAGKTNYVTLLGAYALVLAVNLVLGFLLVIPLVFGLVGIFAIGSSAGLGVLAVIGGFVALVGLAYLVGYFFVQFYAHAIVLDDQGMVDGFRHSVGLVRGNLVPTAGYTLVLVVLGGLFGAVVGVGSVFVAPQPTMSGAEAAALPLPDLSTSVRITIGVVMFAVTALASGFFLVFSVAFYREIGGGSSS